MNIYTSIEAISILSFILFSLLCFTRIENNTDINKIAYLFTLFFQAFLGFVYYIFVLNFISNKLALVTSLLIVILFSIFFILSIFSFQFIRLRILFVPFFLIIIIFRFLICISSLDKTSEVQLFESQYLVIHIITSLLSYSLITISLVTSYCIVIQDSNIKKMRYNRIINNFLPSLYESEILAIRFLYLTIIFLIISLVSGLNYFIETGDDLIYFFNEKVVFSLISLFLTLMIIIVRTYRGLSGKMVFRMVLLSYFLISFSYFGVRLLN